MSSFSHSSCNNLFSSAPKIPMSSSTQDRSSLIHFDHNIVNTKVEELASSKNEINYLIYLFILFFGLLSFIGTILIIDNYKKYKLN